MTFEDKQLSTLTEQDILALIASGRRESAILEYKSELYEPNDHGNREFLLDACMFANTSGGTLLIGIPELRDADNKATGLPDPQAVLGVNCANPEQTLLTFESRVVEAIDERLPIELFSIACGHNRCVLAMRVPNSLAKPHRVRYKGHTYFPSRRERHRYELDAREIKDLAMRTASQSDRAETTVRLMIERQVTFELGAPILVASLLPVFFNNFVVDLKKEAVFNALATFPLAGGGSHIPNHSVDGLIRLGPRNDALSLAHNGLIKLRVPIPSKHLSGGSGVRFYPTAIDVYVRSLVAGAPALFEAASLSAPALLGVSLWTDETYVVAYDETAGTAFPARNHTFPILPLITLGPSADPQVRNLCDLIHQIFGRSGSPCFTAVGQWRGPR